MTVSNRTLASFLPLMLTYTLSCAGTPTSTPAPAPTTQAALVGQWITAASEWKTAWTVDNWGMALTEDAGALRATLYGEGGKQAPDGRFKGVLYTFTADTVTWDAGAKRLDLHFSLAALKAGFGHGPRQRRRWSPDVLEPLTVSLVMDDAGALCGTPFFYGPPSTHAPRVNRACLGRGDFVVGNAAELAIQRLEKSLALDADGDWKPLVFSTYGGRALAAGAHPPESLPKAVLDRMRKGAETHLAAIRRAPAACYLEILSTHPTIYCPDGPPHILAP